MVQILPGVADQLAPSIDAFAKGLEKYLKPNLEFQKAMQKAIGANPALAQQLADLEKKAPGTLSNMGFGDLGKVISSIPESAQGQVARESQPDIVDSEKKKIALESGQTGFSLDNLHKTIDFLNKQGPDSNVPVDVIRKSLGLPSQLGEQIQQSEATIKGNEAAVSGKLADVQSQNADVELQKLNLAHQNLDKITQEFPQLQSMDPVNMVRRMMGGHSVPQFTDFLQTPKGEEAFTQARIIAEMQANRDNREAMRSLAKSTDPEERQNIIQAGAALRATHVGTLQSWRTVLEHPEQSAVIQNKKGPLSQEEKDIIASESARADQQAELDLKHVQQINYDLGTAVSHTQSLVKQGGSPAVISAGLAQINNVLTRKTAATGQAYRAVYGPPPDIGESGTGKRFFGVFDRAPTLYYVDKKGVRVEDNKPFAEPDVGLIADANRALMEITGLQGKVREDAIAKAKKTPIWPYIQDKIK